MADKLMYTPNDDTQNYPFCRLKSIAKTLKLMNQLIKLVPKVVKPANKNIIIKLWVQV